MNSSFTASVFISRRVTGSSRIGLLIIVLISLSMRSAAITESSRSSFWVGINLDRPSACVIFFKERNSNLNS